MDLAFPVSSFRPRPKTIHSLPPETLREIFLHVSQADQPPQALSAGILAAVCSRWRAIALSYSALWSHIHVVPSSLYPSLQTLALWIDRSGRTLLHVYIRSIEVDPLAPPALAREVEEQGYLVAAVNMLAPTCNRWKSLDFRGIDFVNVFQEVRFELAKELRIVRTTSLFVPQNTDHEVQERTFLTAIFTTPHLTCLELPSYYPENILRLTQNFSWHFLTDLDLTWTCPLEFIAQALSMCISVVYLSIHVMQPITNVDAFPKKIALPNMKVLKVEYGTTDAFALFFSLECLNLDVLEIEFGWFPQRTARVIEQPFGLLDSFIEHGRHRIQEFRLKVKEHFKLDHTITNVLLHCRQAGISDVMVTIPKKWVGTTELNSLNAISEVLNDIPTALPPLVIYSPWGGPIVVGWYDQSHT